MRLVDRMRAVRSDIGVDLTNSALCAKSAVAFALWALFPAKRTVLHLGDSDGPLHPLGARWHWVSGNRQCSHCRSMHPMDFLENFDGCARWVPIDVVNETKRLIDSGDMEDTAANHNRWMHIPPGSVALRVVTLGEHLSVRGTTAHEDSILLLDHVGELSDDDFELFQVWLAEMLPEVAIHRSGHRACVHYDPASDPSLVPVMVIQPEE